MGLFYCPGDRKVHRSELYQTPRDRLALLGRLCSGLRIAHEVGHHVREPAGHQHPGGPDAAAGSGRAELNRLCRCGLEPQDRLLCRSLARHAQNARQILEQGDVEEAMNAAARIGDDACSARGRWSRSARAVSRTAPARSASRWISHGAAAGQPEVLRDTLRGPHRLTAQRRHTQSLSMPGALSRRFAPPPARPHRAGGETTSACCPPSSAWQRPGRQRRSRCQHAVGWGCWPGAAGGRLSGPWRRWVRSRLRCRAAAHSWPRSRPGVVWRPPPPWWRCRFAAVLATGP